MSFLCSLYGIFVGFLCIGFLLGSCGISTICFWLFLWDFFTIAIGFLWDSRKQLLESRAGELATSVLGTRCLGGQRHVLFFFFFLPPLSLQYPPAMISICIWSLHNSLKYMILWSLHNGFQHMFLFDLSTMAGLKSSNCYSLVFRPHSAIQTASEK